MQLPTPFGVARRRNGARLHRLAKASHAEKPINELDGLDSSVPKGPLLWDTSPYWRLGRSPIPSGRSPTTVVRTKCRRSP